MTPRGRALLEGLALAALLVAGVFLERARGAVETHYLVFAALVASWLARRLLVVAGRARPVPLDLLALELASFSGLVVFPFGRFGIGLGALATLAHALRRPSDEALPARALDETAPALVALAALLLGALGRRAPGPALVLAGLLALEAWGPGAPRTGEDAARRVAAFALALALACIRGYEKGPEGPLAEELLFFFSATATAATLARARPRLGRVPGLGAAATIAGWALAHPLLATILVRGGPATWAFFAAHVALLLFVLAPALSHTARPGKAALGAALLASSFVAGEGALMAKIALRGLDDPVIVHPFAAPLVAVAQRQLIGEDDAGRRDFHDHDFTPKKPAGTYRVVLLGGSSAYGPYLPGRAQAPSGRIEAWLAAARPSLRPEVLCLAWPGLTSDQELGWLAGHALGWEPDLVLALDDYNDLAYLSGRAKSPGDMYCWPQHRYGFRFPVRRSIAALSRLAQPLVVPGALRGVLPFRPEEFLRPGAGNGFFEDGLVANEEAMAILAREAGARFVWASVPLVYDLPTPTDHDRALFRPSPLREELVRRVEAARQRIPPAIVPHGGVATDLPARIARQDAAAPGETWFVDECHWSERGVDVIARELVAAIVEAGVLPR